MKRTFVMKSSLALTMSALLLASAQAAPTLGSSDDNVFYTSPAVSSLNSLSNGELVSYRPATVKLGYNAPAASAWNIIYKTTDSRDRVSAVSGTVIVPTTPWTGTGPRPVLMYAIGTHGLASKCAPSKQLALGKDYEAVNMAAALKAGYAVVLSDYRGSMSGSTLTASSTYLSGKAQGNAIVDAFRAASKVPDSGVSTSAPAVIWGYSQGGQTAVFAAENLSTYAPELDIKGVAFGGVPADLFRAARYLNGSTGFSFLGSSVVGLNNQYPGSIPLNLLLDDNGTAAIAKLNTQCVFEALFDFQNDTIEQYTVGESTLEDFLSIESINEVLTKESAGKGTVTVPMYQYHGQADEFLPLDQAVVLKNNYCAKGTPLKFDLYPSEHIATLSQAAPYVMSWFADRLEGKPAPTSCNNTKPIPGSTANPGGGNYVVTLDKWKLDGTIKLKLLNQTITLPSTSTLTANADITSKTLTGALSIPKFSQPVKIIGINFNMGIRVEPAGPVSGSVSVDNEGKLSIRAKAPANVIIESLWGIPIGQCKTVAPVDFPIFFDGSVSDLGSGDLKFGGSVNLPQFKGCIISAIITTVMLGGQDFGFTVQPPAPVSY